MVAGSAVVITSFGLHYNSFVPSGMSELGRDLRTLWEQVI